MFRPTRLPLTLRLGLFIILSAELLLFADIRLSHRSAARTSADFVFVAAREPATLPAIVSRFVAINMTPLAWLGYILLLDGLLTVQTGTSPIRQRPHHFALLAIASILIWCLFDWINFYYIHAWSYLGLPENAINRFFGYAISFATIVPGMLLTAQLLLNTHWFDWANTQALALPRWLPRASFMAGALMFAWPFVARDPVTNLTLWTSLAFLLDPVNLRLGRPSFWRHWQAGLFAPTLSLFAAGLICGLLWEFWNYWALAKWIYRLPFLGPAEHLRLFEMPLPGFAGFLPFALECWVLWQFLRIPFDGLAEPLPDANHLL